MAERREATQPGGKYIDFSVTQPDGKVMKLSDYVGKGKYTLVDFWASWCGPCIPPDCSSEDIYNKYKDSGKLDVLGVAVWDGLTPPAVPLKTMSCRGIASLMHRLYPPNLWHNPYSVHHPLRPRRHNHKPRQAGR